MNNPELKKKIKLITEELRALVDEGESDPTENWIISIDDGYDVAKYVIRNGRDNTSQLKVAEHIAIYLHGDKPELIK